MKTESICQNQWQKKKSIIQQQTTLSMHALYTTTLK